ncbi:MAG: protein-disulfide isomerase [Acidimicrobiales bacterium]|jgi:protein-disulfide isomerase
MDSETTQGQTQEQTPVQQQSNPLIIPATLLVGFGLIAAAIYFSGGIGSNAPIAGLGIDTDSAAVIEKGPVRPIDEDDHIRGDPNAPIIIMEYSDYDCPFCKNFHETMNQVIDDYGVSGKVAWVYRHFPLEQLHPNAPGIALASECVADLGDNEAFWTFSDLVFGERETNAQTNVTKLSDFAMQAGVDGNSFDECVKEGRFIDKVNEDFADGTNAGVQGTPYSLVLVGGQQGEINGAQPYEAVKQIIETLLGQIESQ